MSMRESPQRSSRPKARVVEHEPTETSETTLSRLQARGERLLHWFPELRKTWQRDGEPGLEALLGHLQSLGGEVSRRAQETGRDLEARAERVLADLERQAVRGLGPLLSRANLVSASDFSGLEDRLRRLEERVDPLLDARSEAASRMTAMERQQLESRIETGERLREVMVRLSATDDLRSDLAGLHEHLDALSKDQVSRSLEIGKLQDRLVRLEMRMGDALRDHDAELAARRELERRLGAVEQVSSESIARVQGLHEQTASVAAEGRATDTRLTALISARNADHDELASVGDLLASVQQTLRQVDLRLGDLGERYNAVREELAGLGARVSHLELAPTRTVGPTILPERSEGH